MLRLRQPANRIINSFNHKFRHFSESSFFEFKPSRNVFWGGFGVTCIGGGLVLCTVYENNKLLTVHDRLRTTYKYIAHSVILTTGMSMMMFGSRFAFKMISINPFAHLGLYLMMVIGSMIGIYTSKYDTECLKKHLFWTMFVATMSGNICILGYVGQKILMQAGLMTGCVVGIFSMFGAYGDPEQMNILAGFLYIGLAIVCYASLASLFWSTSVALETITIQGGLAVFMGLTMTDTSKLIQNAQKNTSFDPINESIGIYLNILNIFIRIVILLSENEQKNKKKFSK